MRSAIRLAAEIAVIFFAISLICLAMIFGALCYAVDAPKGYVG